MIAWQSPRLREESLKSLPIEGRRASKVSQFPTSLDHHYSKAQAVTTCGALGAASAERTEHKAKVALEGYAWCEKEAKCI